MNRNRNVIYAILCLAIIPSLTYYCGVNYEVLDSSKDDKLQSTGENTKNNTEEEDFYDHKDEEENIKTILQNSKLKKHINSIGYSIEVPNYFKMISKKEKIWKFSWANEQKVAINLIILCETNKNSNINKNIFKSQKFISKYGKIKWNKLLTINKKQLKKHNAYTGKKLKGFVETSKYNNYFLLTALSKKYNKSSKLKAKHSKLKKKRVLNISLIGYISIPDEYSETYGESKDAYAYLGKLFKKLKLKTNK
jgi:hypothetical protein